MRFLVILSTLLLSIAAQAAEIKNLIITQNEDKGIATYDLVGGQGEKESDVNVKITIDGKGYTAEKLTLSGDFGKNVGVGVGKRIVWDVLADIPNGYVEMATWGVTSSDTGLTAVGSVFNDPTLGMSFVNIKGGCFEMGDSFGDGDKNEKPLHEVCVDDFSLAVHDVTIRDFRKFTASTNYKTDAEKSSGCVVWIKQKWEYDNAMNWRNPGFAQNERYPAVCVSWNDARAFADWLSKKSGKQYRLPTEAEWEYAARSGGKNHKYAWGNDSPSGNIADEAAKKQFPGWTVWSGYDDKFVYTSPVGSFNPNELGLYDMSGNVWQWLGDWFGDEYYRDSPRSNPKGPIIGALRILRGGSWSTEPQIVRVANRNRNKPGESHSNYGFRLAGSPQ